MVLLDTTDLKTFCVFLNKTTHDFNIYLIFEKYLVKLLSRERNLT